LAQGLNGTFTFLNALPSTKLAKKRAFNQFFYWKMQEKKQFDEKSP